MLCEAGACIFATMSSIEDIGVVIHMLRVIRGLSQGDLARLSQVRNSSISNYERGKAVPQFETIQKLARGLDLPLAAVEEAQEFIFRMRSLGLDGGAVDSHPEGESSAPLSFPSREPAELRKEVEQISGDVGRLASRMTRLVLEILASGYPFDRQGPEPPSQPSQE